MRYDRDFERYRFSTDRVIDRDTVNALYQEYDEYRINLLKTDFKNAVYRMEGVEPGKHKDLLSILIGVTVIICMIGMVIAFATNRVYVGGGLAAIAFGIIGLLMICSKSTLSADRNSNKQRVKTVIVGVLIEIAAIGIALLIIFKDRYDSQMAMILLFIGAFGLTAAGLLIMAFFEIFYAAFFYDEKVRARCTGYVRMVDSESGGGDGGNIPFSYIRMSPVFEYDYRGERYEALYDDLITKKDSDIEMGQYVEIRISSKKPDNVYAGKSTLGNAIVFLIFGILCAGATSVTVWFGFLS